MSLISSAIYNLRPLLPKLKPSKYLCVRSHSFRDEFQDGKAKNNVDGNMHVLKQRMDEVRIRERSNTRPCVGSGWTYKARNLTIHKKGERNSNWTLNITLDLAELIGQMGATYALVFLSGSLGICLMSILVRFCSHL